MATNYSPASEPEWYVYSGTHNTHSDFPPVMSDGRIYASYQPEAAVNNYLIERENIRSNWDYRRYLQQNSGSLMRQNFMESSNEVGLVPYQNVLPTAFNGDHVSPNIPYMYTSTTENSSAPLYARPDLENGSLMRAQYLTREQLQARMKAPYV